MSIRKDILKNNPHFGQKALDYFDSLRLEKILARNHGISGEMDLGKLKKGFYKKIKYRVGLVLPGNPDILFEIAVKKENVRQREYAITILDSKRVEVKGGIYLPGRNSIDITQKLLDEADKAYKAIFE